MRQGTRLLISRAGPTSYWSAEQRKVWRCGASPRLTSRSWMHFPSAPSLPLRSNAPTPSIPISIWVRRCGASSVSVSSLEHKLPTHRLPEKPCHEPLTETDRRPRRARAAPRPLPVAAAPGNSLLRGLAVLEVRLAEGHGLEQHARPVQDRISRPGAPARDCRRDRRFRRIVLPRPP